MISAKPPWHGQLVLVCDKCGGKLTADAKKGDPSAKALKDWLKGELKDRGAWGDTRVVVSSCLDICPKDKMTVGFVSDDGSPATCVVLDPEADREVLLEKILQKKS